MMWGCNCCGFHFLSVCMHAYINASLVGSMCLWLSVCLCDGFSFQFVCACLEARVGRIHGGYTLDQLACLPGAYCDDQWRSGKAWLPLPAMTLSK